MTKLVLAVFLVAVLSLSILQFPIPQVKAQPSVTNIPFTSGNIAPYIAYDNTNQRAWATKYASGGSDTTGGLFRWDRANGTLKQFIIPASMEDGSVIQATGIALDGSGNPWVVTTRKLYKFSPQDGIFTVIQNVAFGYEMVFDGTYIWIGYNDGVLRVNPSTQAVDTVVISNNKAFAFLTPFNSGVLVVEVQTKKVYEVSSSLAVSQRLTELNNPYGIGCSGTTCYLAEQVLGRILEIDTSTWVTTIRNLESGSRPSDVVIYSTYAIVLNLGTKTVRVFNIPAWTSFTNVSLSYTPLYGNVDALGRVYVGFYGSSGIIIVENLFENPNPQPEPKPQPPGASGGVGEGDQRKNIGLKLSGDFLAKKGQSLNITTTLTKVVSGFVYLYAGENYIGRELLASIAMDNSSQKTIQIKPNWVGSKSVFAKYSGDSNYKGNVSSYIKLESVLPVSGIRTIRTNVIAGNSEIVVSLHNNDKYYIQNTTTIIQIKNFRGEVIFFAWLRDLQVQPDSSQSFNFPRGEILQGIIEVYVWKSLEGGVLAEVSKTTTRN